MRFPYTQPFEWRTPLSVEETAQALRGRVISRWALFRSRAEFPVAGSVKDGAAVLFARPPFAFHNSFNRVLDVRFERLPEGGTVLRGVFRFERPAAIFMIFWFGILSMMTIVTTFAMFHERGFAAIRDGSLYIPWGMAAGGAGMVWFGAFLRGFLSTKWLTCCNKRLGPGRRTGLCSRGCLVAWPSHQ